MSDPQEKCGDDLVRMGKSAWNSPTDPVHSPAHYKAGELECRDVQKALARTLWSGSPHLHPLSNALKYLFRCCSKGKFAEDVKKAAYECLSCVDEEWRLRVPPGTVPAKPQERFAIAIRDTYEWQDEDGDKCYGQVGLRGDRDAAGFIRSQEEGAFLSARQCRELAAHLTAWAQQWEDRNK